MREDEVDDDVDVIDGDDLDDLEYDEIEQDMMNGRDEIVMPAIQQLVEVDDEGLQLGVLHQHELDDYSYLDTPHLADIIFQVELVILAETILFTVLLLVEY